MKRIFTILLLIVGVFATAALAQDTPGRLAAPDWVDPATSQSRPDILVYYFHNTFRCQTCLMMEREAENVVLDDFAAEIDSGLLRWIAVNLEEPEYEHFTLHYSLDGPSLVLVEWGDNEERRWKNLDRIWELAESPPEFREYVRRELAAYITSEAPAEKQ